MQKENLFDEVHDSQRCYRLLLDSMARPGKINMLPAMEIIPPTGLNEACALISLTLLNADVSFHVSHKNAQQIENYLLMNTAAIPSEPELANFIFITGDNDGGVLAEAQTGTLSYPEEGATCIVSVACVSSSHIPNSLKIMLEGPGIDGQSVCYVAGLNVSILENFGALNTEFPLGIDMIMGDVNNQIICIPRSSRVMWEI